MEERSFTVGIMALIAAIAVVGAAAPVAAGTGGSVATVAANNTTATETATPADASTCTPGEQSPSLEQSRLYSPDPTIEQDSPGRVSGAFSVSGDQNCPVVVQITMSVPSGVEIRGTSDVLSGGGGLVTAEFTVEPGTARSIRAQVYANNVGEHTVVADIKYWPQGHPDMSRQIDGIMLDFNVKEPVTPAAEGGGGGGDTSGAVDGWPVNTTLEWALAVISVVVLALLVLVGYGMRGIRDALPDTIRIGKN